MYQMSPNTPEQPQRYPCSYPIWIEKIYCKLFQGMHMCDGRLTTEGTAPGLNTLRAFTTWNTSTTPSVLQRSMVVAMEQYIPERVAVSLGGRKRV